MNDFNERLTYGEGAISEATNILDKYNIPYKKSQDYWDTKWSNTLDKIYGDIIILSESSDPLCWIDVKRNSVSIESINAFKGNYYWIFDTNLNRNIFLPPEYFISANLPIKQLWSGDPGYKIGDIPKHIDKKYEYIRSGVLGYLDPSDIKLGLPKGKPKLTESSVKTRSVALF